MEAPIIQANWLKKSMPVLTELFIIAHDINTKGEHKEFNLMQNLNFGTQITTLFFSLYSFSMCFIFFLAFTKKFMAKKLATSPKIETTNRSSQAVYG